MAGVVRRRRKRKGGFLLGTLIGAAAGLAGGTVLLRRAAGIDEDRGVLPEPLAEAAGDATATARRTQAEMTGRAQGAFDALRERWREAVEEGKEAAAQRERELEAQYARETKRIPEAMRDEE